MLPSQVSATNLIITKFLSAQASDLYLTCSVSLLLIMSFSKGASAAIVTPRPLHSI